MSQAYYPDDVEVPVVSYGSSGDVKMVSNASLLDMKEEAVSAQRLAVCRLMRKHAAGKAQHAVPEYGRKMGNQKMFRLNKLIEWTGGNPDVVVEALRAGRLRCRLNAAMGVGKSTLLASYVARAMDYRVLHISLDAQALQQMAVYVNDSGIGRFSRRWTDVRKAHLSCMTYDDFCGHMATGKRAELFKCFDLLIFDEGFVKNEAAVEVAGWFFSEYALANTNLILCSGTLRTDVSEAEMGSRAVGNFNQTSKSVSVEDAMRSGKLVTDYLVDRTMVVVPSNDKVYTLVEHYSDNGVDVRFLDDASDYEALREVVSWLTGDSTVPRVVVAHWRYYIAFNFPLSYMIIWPYYEVTKCVDGVCRQEEVPMSEAMVAQAKSRTGRGIVDGSGGVVMSPDRSEDVELISTERMRAFVLLCAGAIKPLRTPYWEECYKVFPDALTPGTAMNILKICLPVQIAARYLGRDGYVAARFCRALNTFAQPDHYLNSSKDEFPVGYESWGTFEHSLSPDDDAVESFKLPYDCDGELKVVLVAIELISQDRITVERWRMRRALALNDGYDSDEEQRDSRFAKPSVVLRRIEERPLPAVPSVEPVRTIPWEYRSIEPGVSANRSGGFINSDRCRQALLDLEKCLPEYRVPSRVIEEVVEEADGSVTPIVVDGLGDVESPGGSVVCKLPVKICEKMNLGQELSSKEFVKVATAARLDADKFVASKLFDCFAGPWQSFLDSLLNNSVAEEVVRKGIASDVYALVDRLRFRFNVEVCSVLAGSHVFKTTYLRVFRRVPTADDVMRQVRAGKFDKVAQTDGFIDRIKHIKGLIDDVLLYAERNSVYLPTYITNAQRSMPIRGSNKLGYVGDDVHGIPRRARRYIEGGGGHRRHGSFSEERAGR